MSSENPFAITNSFINNSVTSITDELKELDKLSAEGVDINPMLEELQEKVSTLRARAKEMIDFIFDEQKNNI